MFGKNLPDPVKGMANAGASQGTAFADAYIKELKRAYDAYLLLLAGKDPSGCRWQQGRGVRDHGGPAGIGVARSLKGDSSRAAAAVSSAGSARGGTTSSCCH